MTWEEWHERWFPSATKKRRQTWTAADRAWLYQLGVLLEPHPSQLVRMPRAESR